MPNTTKAATVNQAYLRNLQRLAPTATASEVLASDIAEDLSLTHYTRSTSVSNSSERAAPLIAVAVKTSIC